MEDRTDRGLLHHWIGHIGCSWAGRLQIRKGEERGRTVPGIIDV